MQTACLKLNAISTYRGGHWDFRFCGSGYFLDRFFGFGVHCGLRIFRFLESGFRFSQKILAVFRFCYPIWFFGVPVLSYLGSGFSSI